MASQPPPQVSPDGKFYWDGEKWVPFQGAVAAQPSRVVAAQPSSRRGCFTTVGVVLVVLVAVSICVASRAPGGGGVSHPKPVIDLSGRSSTQSSVGAEDAVSLTVTNKGPGDFQTLIVYLNSKDDWFKHHVITDPSGCTINSSLERLECGPLKVGETRTLSVVASPKDAGNFNFEVGIADQEGSALYYPDLDALDWSEAVTP
jgi:hypothetical protein